jgi:hypothetical protein
VAIEQKQRVVLREYRLDEAGLAKFHVIDVLGFCDTVGVSRQIMRRSSKVRLLLQELVEGGTGGDREVAGGVSPGPDASRTREGHASKSAYRNSKFALRVKGRFNPFRDSVAYTIVMRWQRRFKSHFLMTKRFCV